MIEPDWVDPTQDPKPEDKTTYREFIREVFTTKIGGQSRFILPLGFFAVAMQDNIWVALVLACVWSLSAQFALFGAHTDGWLAGVEFVDELDGNPRVDMVDFLAMCERHGVPPQELEKLIWRDEK